VEKVVIQEAIGVFDQGGMVGQNGQVTESPGHEVSGDDERGNRAPEAVHYDKKVGKEGKAGSGADSNVRER
jgi:hypothetical protein